MKIFKNPQNRQIMQTWQLYIGFPKILVIFLLDSIEIMPEKPTEMIEIVPLLNYAHEY